MTQVGTPPSFAGAILLNQTGSYAFTSTSEQTLTFKLGVDGNGRTPIFFYFVDYMRQGNLAFPEAKFTDLAVWHRIVDKRSGKTSWIVARPGELTFEFWDNEIERLGVTTVNEFGTPNKTPAYLTTETGYYDNGWTIYTTDVYLVLKGHALNYSAPIAEPFQGSGRFILQVDDQDSSPPPPGVRSSLWGANWLGNGMIEPFHLTVDGQELDVDPTTQIASGSGDTALGRTDGTDPMLRAGDATASYTKSTIDISSPAFSSAMGGVIGSLWGGSVKIDVPSRTGAIVDDGTSGTFKLAGLDVDFESLTMLQDSMAFDVLFKLPGETGGFVVDTVKVLDDALIIDSSGARLALGGKLSIPNIPGLQIGPMALDAKNVSLEYKAGEDSLYLQGKLTFKDPLANAGGVSTSVEADLTDENFLRIRDGKAELVGGVTIKDIPLTAGWALKDVSLSMNADKNTVTGSATISTPLGLKFGDEGISVKPTLQFTYAPFHFDGAGLQIDNINKPIPFFPQFYFQSIGGSVLNLSPSSKEDVKIAATIGATLGPQIDGSSLMRLDLTGEITSSKLVGQSKIDFLPLEFEGLGAKETLKLGTATGKTTLNYQDWVLTQEGSFNFLDGLIKTETALRIDSDFNYGNFGKATVGIPDFIPYFGGAELANSAYTIQFSNDGNFANDYLAGWGQYTVRKLGLEADLTLGVRFNLDGTIDRIGSHNIPAKPTNLVPPAMALASLTAGIYAPLNDTAAQGTGEALDGAEYILLAVRWETASSAAKLIVTKPDGTMVTEDQFAEHNIAVVDEFSSSTERVAIAFNPEAGTWKVGVADAQGLGTVTGDVLGESAAPTLIFQEPIQQSRTSATISYSAFDADSAANITFWYDDDLTELNGLLIGSKTEADGSGSIVWDTTGVTPGQYFVYALVDDGENPVVYALSGAKVTVLPNAAPVITSNGAGETATIALAQDRKFVTTALAADTDGDAITYSIAGGPDAAKFVINAANGQLTFKTAPDFEAPSDSDLDNRYEVIISAFDGLLSDAQAITVAISQAPSAVPDFMLVTVNGFAGAIGGRGQVFGTIGFQDIAILNEPGTVNLDTSFNQGGDIVRLSGNASAFTISRLGSNAILSDGDTIVSIPVGSAGLPLVFDDGARMLKIDTVSGTVKIGVQTLSNVASTITAAADNSPLPTGQLTDAAARLTLTPGANVKAGGDLNVFGTTGVEEMLVVRGDAVFDTSFNRGGDTISLSGKAEEYTAYRSGSTMVVASDDTSVRIPIGVTGLTLDFGADERSLRYDAASQHFLIGDQIITATNSGAAVQLQVDTFA